jgi:hypothetical protein
MGNGLLAGLGEAILEMGCDELDVLGTGEEGEGSLGDAGESAQVVDSVEMVGVGVGQEDGVEPSNVSADGLFAEVAAEVDEDADGLFWVWGVEPGGGAKASVPRVLGTADRTIATNHGDAVRGSSAEKCAEKFRHRVIQLTVLVGS